MLWRISRPNTWQTRLPILVSTVQSLSKVKMPIVCISVQSIKKNTEWQKYGQPTHRHKLRKKEFLQISTRNERTSFRAAWPRLGSSGNAWYATHCTFSVPMLWRILRPSTWTKIMPIPANTVWNLSIREMPIMCILVKGTKKSAWRKKSGIQWGMYNYKTHCRLLRWPSGVHLSWHQKVRISVGMLAMPHLLQESPKSV